jgi:nucleotide-binding universal stress UspA family protein
MQVLLIIDDSEDSSRAVEAVQERRWPVGTNVLVLAVAPRRRFPPSPPPMLLALRGDWRFPRDEAARARALVQLAVETLRSSGLAAIGKVRLGHPHQEILREVRECAADLIVVGSARLTPLQRLLFGSRLASSVAMDAPCSVEVIRERRDNVPAKNATQDRH